MPLAARLAPLMLLSCALSPALAQDAKALREENARLRQELDELRVEKNRLQDERIAGERRFDEVKRRLMQEKEELQARVAELQRAQAAKEGAPAPDAQAPAGDKLDQRLATQAVSLSFDTTPLGEAIDFLRDITRLSFELDPGLPEGLTITLRIRELPLKWALTLIVDNLRPEEGDAPAVEWVREKDVIKVRPATR